jgi:hypothetical protein
MASDCDAALVRDVKTLSWNLAETYAYAELVWQLRNDDANAHLGVRAPIDGFPVKLDGTYARKASEPLCGDNRRRRNSRLLSGSMQSSQPRGRRIIAFRIRYNVDDWIFRTS